jgi:hypothetical protein
MVSHVTQILMLSPLPTVKFKRARQGQPASAWRGGWRSSSNCGDAHLRLQHVMEVFVHPGDLCKQLVPFQTLELLPVAHLRHRPHPAPFPTRACMHGRPTTAQPQPAPHTRATTDPGRVRWPCSSHQELELLEDRRLDAPIDRLWLRLLAASSSFCRWLTAAVHVVRDAPVPARDMGISIARHKQFSVNPEV